MDIVVKAMVKLCRCLFSLHVVDRAPGLHAVFLIQYISIHYILAFDNTCAAIMCLIRPQLRVHLCVQLCVTS